MSPGVVNMVIWAASTALVPSTAEWRAVPVQDSSSTEIPRDGLIGSEASDRVTA
jgi:hypothetical protein